jgi:hypothetical protein
LALTKTSPEIVAVIGLPRSRRRSRMRSKACSS